MKTIQEKNISVCANKSRRTFTIRINGNKYRTVRMNKEDFSNNMYNTANDWRYFLRSCDSDYYSV